jgi:hypothetical protein
MELLRITDTQAWLPDRLIENYTSLIWTERYREPGEFELKTPDIEGMRGQLPIGSFVTLQDSREVMIVESHAVKSDPKGALELTITGRTFEVILENRILRWSYQAPIQTVTSHTAVEFAALYIWNELVNNSTTDALRNIARILSPTDGYIPYVVVGIAPNYIPKVNASQQWWVSDGCMATQIQSILKDADVGIRIKRPPTPQTFKVEAFLNYVGNYHNVYVIPELLIEVYSGVLRPQVAFSINYGNLESPGYLFSNKNYKNVAYVDTKLGGLNVYANPSDASTTGLARRVLYVDGSDVAGTDLTYSEILPALEQKGRQELLNYRPQFIFDVSMTNTDPYVYGVDYDLGDTVTLKAHFGIEQPMRVTEFIRSEDSSGEKSYPTLEQV